MTVMTNPINEDAPFIIWTFRRTGGTRLGAMLFERSSHETVEHEPFNLERTFGDVTNHYRKTGDEAALRVQMHAICERKVVIKHCLELMTPGLNRALAEASTAAGYRHVFLFRRRPLGRLLSLHYAQQSGIWGKEQARSTPIDEDAIFSQPLPIERLLAHERLSRARMAECYRVLRSLGANPLLVAFEDIYATDDLDAARERLLEILDVLGLPRGEASDREFLDATLRGEQGTRSQYSRFPNHAEFAAASERLGAFSPDAPGMVVEQLELPGWLERFTIWPPERKPGRDDCVLSGIFLPRTQRSGQLWFEYGDGRRLQAAAGLESKGFARRHPDNVLSTRARFRFDELPLAPGMDGECVWVDETGERTRLATIGFK